MSTSEQRLAAPDDRTSSRAKHVSLSLRVGGETGATDRQRTLGLSKLALVAVLESLVANDLVRRTEGCYVCR